MTRPPTAQISRTKWAILFSEQGGCCAGCFKPLGEDVHVDHVNPLAGGGQDVFENLQLLHARCNQQKGDMAAEAWFGRQRRMFIAEVAAIRRRQMLVTIDPELASRLRAAAKKVRRPVSELIEESARRMLDGRWRGEPGPVPTPASWAAAIARGDHPDLFRG